MDEMTFLRVLFSRQADGTVPGSNKLRPDQIHTRASKSTNRYSGLWLLGIYSHPHKSVKSPIFMRPGVGGALIPLGIGVPRKVPTKIPPPQAAAESMSSVPRRFRVCKEFRAPDICTAGPFCAALV